MEIKELEGKKIRLRWLQGITLDICTGLDKEDEGIFDRETFNKDETCEVDVFGIDEDRQTIDIQFGDGSVATAISTALFVVEEVEE